MRLFAGAHSAPAGMPTARHSQDNFSKERPGGSADDRLAPDASSPSTLGEHGRAPTRRSATVPRVLHTSPEVRCRVLPSYASWDRPKHRRHLWRIGHHAALVAERARARVDRRPVVAVLSGTGDDNFGDEWMAAILEEGLSSCRLVNITYPVTEQRLSTLGLSEIGRASCRERV